MSYIDLGDPNDDRYVDVSPATISPLTHCYLAVADEIEVGVKLDRDETQAVIDMLQAWLDS